MRQIIHFDKNQNIENITDTETINKFGFYLFNYHFLPLGIYFLENKKRINSQTQKTTKELAEKIIKCFQEVVNQKPESPDAFRNLGYMFHHVLNDLNKSKKYLDKSLDKYKHTHDQSRLETVAHLANIHFEEYEEHNIEMHLQDAQKYATDFLQNTKDHNKEHPLSIFMINKRKMEKIIKTIILNQ